MATTRAPKQWQLTKNETINSFENWRQNLLYILSLDNNFEPFLADGFTWKKKTAANPHRGLQPDGESIRENLRKSAAQKNAQLELMLGQIANYCSVISRNSIIKQSVSLSDIWQKIRQHYGFQSTGAHFLDLSNIKLETDEKPQDLYQRLMAFIEDNLLTTDCGILHHGETIPSDEELTPTVENFIVQLWLQLIHPGLPQLVKQKYGSELRNKTLASIKPEISQALPSLIDELRSIEDTKVLRTSTYSNPGYRRNTMGDRIYNQRRPTQKLTTPKSCILCKTAGRPSHNTHTLVECKFLPAKDRYALGHSRFVTADIDADADDIQADEYPCDQSPAEEIPTALIDLPSAMRVSIIQSPFLNTYYLNHPVKVILDTGATTNMMRASYASLLGVPVTPATQFAHQADGVTPLHVVGEVHCQLSRGQHSFQLDALVVEQLDVDVLAGNPFLVANDIATRPAKRQIVIKGTDIVHYGPQPNRPASIRRTQASILRCHEQHTLLPGDFIQVKTPVTCQPDSTLAIEPRYDNKINKLVKPEKAWPQPQEIQSIDHAIRITNTTSEPIILKRHDHICQVREISPVSKHADYTPDIPHTTPPRKPYSANIVINTDNKLQNSTLKEFKRLHDQFDDVFNPNVSRYNGSSGHIEAVVNMGPVLPPQRKGRLPHYNRDTLIELQAKFDELETLGVFAKPEQVNATVEYLNLSFLVRKPSGGSRLVTSFGEVAQYSKPQPSLMPNVDNVLRDIARWKYIITTDLHQAYYQIPLSQKSMKYCGVVTPFKGIRVYTRSAMGMPGSETCLEELMCRVLGHLIQEGCVTKIADDLYIGGNTEEEIVANWERTLTALSQNNLRLSAKKTHICPRSTTILGWTWSNGTLSASPHRIAALSSVSPPTTVKGLRSFIGAYKVLSRVLRGYAELMDPLDQATAGKQPRDKINWTDDLTHAFKDAQVALKNNKIITIPRPADQLWIVTDGSVKKRGIAATLYCRRDEDILLSGFFNAKLKKHQITWLPCEIEALSIGMAVKHFAPYIVQSQHTTQMLTDSRPCVQAYNKLRRGEFSTSSRVTTYLSLISRYMVDVQHIAGIANLPTDFASRNPIQCQDRSCQVCKFVAEAEESVVRSLTVSDVVEGSARMPFTGRAAWLATQMECGDLRRTHSHLTQGTRPSKKVVKIPDVKRYLRHVIIANDGLLIVKDSLPFQPPRERIVVPRSVIHGLLTSVHLRFNHPTKYQLKRLINRYFFALDMDKAIDITCSSCHHCSSLQSVPTLLRPQSTSSPAQHIGMTFAADIMRRHRQYVFVLRETVSSYTLSRLIDNEQHNQIREAIVTLCAELRPLGDNTITIRIDSGPGLAALTTDTTLKAMGIQLETGNVKNINKNPVAENAIKELGHECLNINPEGGPLTPVTLALATANMNARIRRDGLSARETWTQRDQITGEQLPIEDRHLILQQHFHRISNHASSSKSKAHGRKEAMPPNIEIGDLVYLYGDRDKTRGRDRYLVVDIADNRCALRKFTKSQFRSKTYNVPITECYHVQLKTQQPLTDPIRGLDYEVDNISEGHTDPNATDMSNSIQPQSSDTHQTLQNNELPSPPPTLITPPTDEVSPNTSADSVPTEVTNNGCNATNPHNQTSSNNINPTCDTLPSRPTRIKKPPQWQTTGDWILN